MKPRTHNTQRGSAALLGLLFGLAMLALISTATSLASIHLRSAARARGEANARAAAESGAAASLATLAAGEQSAQLSAMLSQGRYRARCSRRGSQFTIESTGTASPTPGLLLDCRVRLRGTLQAGRARYTACSVQTLARRGKL